jgi:hypothetical protein
MQSKTPSRLQGISTHMVFIDRLPTTLIVVESGPDLFEVIEPVTGVVLQNSVLKDLAEHYAMGFTEMMVILEGGAVEKLSTGLGDEYRLQAFNQGAAVAYNLHTEWLRKNNGGVFCDNPVEDSQ